ncbi:hypothetical protein B566_EDAN011925 [Ephemera danica]|nr:hypothetical protein B566_EDAN011925 [Ephemera danica]
MPHQIFKHYNLLYNPQHVITDGLVIPPNTVVQSSTLQRLLTFLHITNNSTNNIIMGGDLNAHHQAWGSLRSTPKGQNIVQFIENNDLACLNSGKFTRLGSPNQSNSAIDITIVSANLILSSLWDSHEDSMGSDHLPIITKLQLTNNHPSQFNFNPQGKRIFKKADWQSYTTKIQSVINNNNPQQAIQTYSYSTFVKHLDSAASSSIPVSRSKRGSTFNTHPYKKWWTEECDKAKEKRKEATKKLSRLITAQTKQEYDRIHNETRLILRKAKTMGWVKTCNSFTRLTPMSTIWQQVQAFQYSAARLQKAKKLIPPVFTGFRKGYSTNDSLSTIHTDIQLNLARKKTSLLELFDIQGAYDNVNLAILMKKLRKLGIPNSICQILHIYLSYRKIQTRINDKTSSIRCRYRGLPQGSILSPILFLLYTVDLADYIPPEDSKTMFADDLSYATLADNIQDAVRKAEQANYGIAKWLKDSDLSINPDKCECMIFSTSRLKQNYNQIRFGNQRIKRVKQHRLLGIIFDDNLSWKPHIDYLVKTCRQGINILKATCHRWWGASPKTAITLFKAIIRSRLEYGSSIFGNASQTQWSRLERVQNSAIRTILSAFPSSPIPALLLESGIPPLLVRCKLLANKFMLKVFSQVNHPLKAKIKRLTQNILSGASRYWTTHHIPLLVESWQLIQQWSDNIHTAEHLPIYKLPIQVLVANPQVYLVDVTKEERYNPELVCENLTQGRIQIYTDGSKSDHKTGCAMVNFTTGEKIGYKLPEPASIFTAEATAINLALRYIITQPNNDFAILTDSKSVLLALLNTSPHAKYIWILVQIRSKLSILHVLHKTVQHIWIPAHCGIAGNEAADETAKLAAAQGEVLHIPIPHTDFFPLLTQQQTTAWKNHWTDAWQTIEHNRNDPTVQSWYRKIVPEFPNNPYYPWFTKRPWNRSIISTLTRLRIGHWAFPHLLHRLRMTQSNRCDCGSVGTINHMFFSCPENEDSTAQLILSLININLEPEDNNWDMAPILKSNKPETSPGQPSSSSKKRSRRRDSGARPLRAAIAKQRRRRGHLHSTAQRVCMLWRWTTTSSVQTGALFVSDRGTSQPL